MVFRFHEFIRWYVEKPLYKNATHPFKSKSVEKYGNKDICFNIKETMQFIVFQTAFWWKSNYLGWSRNISQWRMECFLPRNLP